MIQRQIVIGACIGVSLLAFVWSEYLDLRYSSSPLSEKVSLSKKGDYSWSFSPRVTDDYELVVRFHKNVPPPFDYVTEILKEGSFEGLPIIVNWALLEEGKQVSKGGVDNYGHHFVAANPYVEKGVGSFHLSSNSSYTLLFSVSEGHESFNVLAPEVRINHNIATQDWLFGQNLISAALIVLGLALSAIVVVCPMVTNAWRRHAGS